MFYDNFVALCASANKTPAHVGRELGIDKSTISCWKARKTKPSDVNAQKIADYFGVTVEELMGKGIKKERPADGEALIRDLPEDIQQIIRICMNRPELASALLNLAKQIEKD